MGKTPRTPHFSFPTLVRGRMPRNFPSRAARNIPLTRGSLAEAQSCLRVGALGVLGPQMQMGAFYDRVSRLKPSKECQMTDFGRAPSRAFGQGLGLGFQLAIESGCFGLHLGLAPTGAFGPVASGACSVPRVPTSLKPRPQCEGSYQGDPGFRFLGDPFENDFDLRVFL